MIGSKKRMYFRGSIATPELSTDEQLAQMLLALEVAINEQYMGKFRIHVSVDDEPDNTVDTYAIAVGHHHSGLVSDVNALLKQGYELAGPMVINHDTREWDFSQPMIKRGSKANE